MLKSKREAPFSQPKSKGMMETINFYLRKNRVGDILLNRGKLTPEQLESALNHQKEHFVPLGQALIDCGYIRPSELRITLATQSSLRIAAALITLFSGLSGLSSRQAMAGNIKELPQSIYVAFGSASAGSMASEVGQPVALFGTGERSSNDLSSFNKWDSMFERFSREVNNGSSNKVVQQWKENLSTLRGLPLKQMASGVNDLMNKVRYIGDNRNWGKSDYWETPIEFLTYGGDCEDFAIAKYVSLKSLGVPESAMRIAIVKDLQKGIPHAILVVYTQDGPMILDNQIKRMTEAHSISHYKPIFSINRTAWWLHTDRGGTNPTQIASAAK